MNDTNDLYLETFYGPCAYWYAATVGAICTCIVLSNLLFILITLTSKSLRRKSSIWFLVAFATSELIHGLSFGLGSIVLWTNGSQIYRHLCSLAGTGVILSATCSFGFPFLIAADRYYKITIQPIGSLGKKLFTERLIIPLIIGWCCISLLGNLPLVLNKVFGEDLNGVCAARRFTEVRLLLLYEMSVMSVYFVSLILAIFYYTRLGKWFKQHEEASKIAEGTDYTKEIMKVMKIIILIPLFFDTPAIILTGGQMALPEFPMWVKRILTVPYFLSSVINPWLSICLLSPFRRRALKLLRKVKILKPESSNIAANIITTRGNTRHK